LDDLSPIVDGIYCIYNGNREDQSIVDYEVEELIRLHGGEYSSHESI
jgi:hypothetical protein